MGNFGPHLRSAKVRASGRDQSLPGMRDRLGGEMGLWVAVLGTRWISVAASDSGAHVFDPALAATAFEVGGLEGL